MEGKPPRRGDLLGQCLELFVQRLENLAGCAPDVEREIDLARNYAERTGLDRDFPDCDHAPVVLCGHELRSLERKVSRRQEGILAELERRRPAVVGLAQEGTLTVDFPGDALDDPNGN